MVDATGRWAALFHSSVPLRFLAVGAFNTGASYAVYLALLAAGLAFPLANLGSLLFGIGWGFVLQGRIVFRNASGRNLAPFVAVWLAIYVFQTGGIWLLVRHGIRASVAGLAVFPAVVVLSYLMQKHLVFARRRPLPR